MNIIDREESSQNEQYKQGGVLPGMNIIDREESSQEWTI